LKVNRKEQGHNHWSLTQRWGEDANMANPQTSPGQNTGYISTPPHNLPVNTVPCHPKARLRKKKQDTWSVCIYKTRPGSKRWNRKGDRPPSSLPPPVCSIILYLPHERSFYKLYFLSSILKRKLHLPPVSRSRLTTSNRPSL
jgi:hypothetical protein